VVLNPPSHGPISGLPVPYKRQPICGLHNGCHRDYSRDWMWYVSMSCGEDRGSYHPGDGGYSMGDDMGM
jgi:hypothetical protein